MKWKWYLLRISSIITAGLPAISWVIMLVRLLAKADLSIGRGEWLTVVLLSVLAIMSSVFVIVQWQSSGILLRSDMQDLSKAIRRAGWGLAAGCFTLICWVLMALGSLVAVYNLGEAAGSEVARGLTTVAVITGLFMLLFVVAFLLAINAYFELKYRRRQAEEELVIGIGLRP